MMRKFEVGDIVVGNEGSRRYKYTSKSKNFVGKVVDDDYCGGIKVETLECVLDCIGTTYPVDPEHFELKEPEIEIGDKVRVRRDITLEELDSPPWATKTMYDIMTRPSVMTVEDIFEDYIRVEENTWNWGLDWFEVVEKAPKTLYFDARRMIDFNINNVKSNFVVDNHGKLESDISGKYSLFSGWLTEEKPEPLKIIDGKVL